MGAPAIITAAGASLGALSRGGLRRNVVLAAWIVASLALAALIAAEIWRARHVGLPTFTPARWTTVFPLGMYSTACQLAGAALSLGWLRELGRLWLTVALAAWLLVASGELHHVFAPGSQAADSRAGRCG
jgi:tellurite resistance protein TehA-like permease